MAEKSGDNDKAPRLSPRARDEAEARRQRLAKQLRANLRRRKAQSRGRDTVCDGIGGSGKPLESRDREDMD